MTGCAARSQRSGARLCHHRGVARPLSATALLSLVVAAAGCDVYHPEAFDAALDAGPDGRVEPSDGGLDAGLDAEVDGGATDAGRDAAPPDGGPSCVPRQPPPRPSGSDTGGPDVVFGLREVVLDQRGGVWADVALDLDDACTTERVTATCEPPDGGIVQVDGPDGVDNAGGDELFSLLFESEPDVEREARENQAEGDGAVLLHLAGWNGTGDDPRVEAFLAQSVYGVPDGGVRGDPLAWDGTDALFVSEDDFLDGDRAQPLIVDDAAYVSGGQLVMSIPDGRPIYFPWSANLLELTVTGGVLTGTLDAGGSRIDDVTITGRWSVLEVGEALTRMGICPGSTSRVAANRLVRMTADIRSDESTDGLGATCDALSIAVQLDGQRVQLGGVVPIEPDPPACP